MTHCNQRVRSPHTVIGICPHSREIQRTKKNILVRAHTQDTDNRQCRASIIPFVPRRCFQLWPSKCALVKWLHVARPLLFQNVRDCKSKLVIIILIGPTNKYIQHDFCNGDGRRIYDRLISFDGYTMHTLATTTAYLHLNYTGKTHAIWAAISGWVLSARYLPKIGLCGVYPTAPTILLLQFANEFCIELCDAVSVCVCGDQRRAVTTSICIYYPELHLGRNLD